MQIFEGYQAFHNAGYVHRDLKPANILVAKDGSLRLADFGFSKKRTLIDRENYNVGTPIYMPRESLTANIYNEKTDVWALGITLYEILFGEVPFRGRTEEELRGNI
jgi:SNF-related kinase